MNSMIAERPAHVPPELVVDFDYIEPPGHREDVHLAWHRLHDDGVPDILWTPHYGGHWIATRADDIDVMQQDYERFSYSAVTIPPKSEMIPLVPLELDPPEHTAYRNLLTPFFGPKQVQALKEEVVRVTNELIDNFQERGECEFVLEFAKRLPVDIFLSLVDLPLEDREELLDMTEQSTRGGPEDRLKAAERLNEYVQYWIKKRREEPGPDIFSAIVNAEIDGRPMTEARTLGMLQNVLFGGLDTVAGALGFVTRFLAESPDHRRQLVDQPEVIPFAIEELLRRFGVPQTARVITRDMDYNGVDFKQGEQVLLAKTLHGLDERRYPDPLTVDFNRRPRDHAAFGGGVHRCLGAGLARRELQVFLEEFLKRIPDFSIKPGDKPVTSAGQVNGMLYLPLSW